MSFKKRMIVIAAILVMAITFAVGTANAIGLGWSDKIVDSQNGEDEVQSYPETSGMYDGDESVPDDAETSNGDQSAVSQSSERNDSEASIHPGSDSVSTGDRLNQVAVAYAIISLGALGIAVAAAKTRKPAVQAADEDEKTEK